MSGEKIFIVEDEKIVAEDLKRMLERMSYTIVGSASNGAEAIKGIEATNPSLVLMDIRIQGELDGIDVAEHVYTHFNIPVIYLTAYADEITVDRAKGTLASGYILKPFDERGIKTTIELVLYKNRMEKLLKGVETWHGGILENLSISVVATDLRGYVTYMNKSAEVLTARTFDESIGKPLNQVLLPSFKFKESPINDSVGNKRGTAYTLVDSCL